MEELLGQRTAQLLLLHQEFGVCLSNKQILVIGLYIQIKLQQLSIYLLLVALLAALIMAAAVALEVSLVELVKQ
jgi:uncharacterized membrane protein YagU involved in acid resistance